MILIWTRHLNIFFSSVLVSNNPPLKIYYENIVVAFLNFNFLFFILIFPYLFFFFIHTFLFFFFFPLFFSTTPFPCLYLHFSFFFSSLALRLLQSIQEALTLSFTLSHSKIVGGWQKLEDNLFSPPTSACPPYQGSNG